MSPRRDGAGGGVELEVARLEHGRALERPAARERAQPRDELGERERLDEVVVGAAVEAGDAVLDRVARGEHQHGRPDAVGAQPPADLEAVDAREHHVEHDRVVVGGARHPQRVLALDRDVGEHPLVAQAAPDQARELDLVLDDQHAHGLTALSSGLSHDGGMNKLKKTLIAVAVLAAAALGGAALAGATSARRLRARPQAALDRRQHRCRRETAPPRRPGAAAATGGGKVERDRAGDSENGADLRAVEVRRRPTADQVDVRAATSQLSRSMVDEGDREDSPTRRQLRS